MKCVKLGLVAGLLLAAGTASGAINYRVNGVAYNPPGFNPAAPVIDVGALTANTTIHVFDDAGLDEDVPAIIVRGTAGFGVVLKVQVVDGADTDAFDQQIDVPIEVGARNFGGLRVEGPVNDPTDTTLRDATAVAVSVTHSITGDVVARQLHRIRARDGDILGDLISIRSANANLFPPIETPNVTSIGFVRAGNEIRGDVVAAGTGSVSQPEGDFGDSIDTIIVGPSANARGIDGDIVAAFRILRIESTGPVGITRRTRIAANLSSGGGGSILQVLVRNQGRNPALPAISLNADVDTEHGAQLRGRGELLRVDGNISGSIEIASLQRETFGNLRAGIIATGAISAPVNIERTLLGDIVGTTITAPVTIGRQLRGSVVATTGNIHSVTIGRGPAATNQRDIGFAGVDCPPVDYSNPQEWFSPSCVSATLGGRDAVIKALHIGSVDIVAMGAQKGNYVPRIEAATVESLKVDRVVEGIIWSGSLEYSSPGVIANVAANDYLVPGAIELGCIGREADVWIDSVLLLPARGDVYGKIHVPALGATQTIRIDGGLRSNDGDPCTCFISDSSTTRRDCIPLALPAAPVEESPRTPTAWTASQREWGEVQVRSQNGLGGQVIIDALNSTESQRINAMDGSVEIGTGSAAIRVSAVASRASGTAFVGPGYTALPATLGGGAIGLVPFGVHEASTLAINTSRTLVTSELVGTAANCSATWAAVDFYGPVTMDINPMTFPPLAVALGTSVNGINLTNGIFQWRRAGHVGTARRQVELRARPDVALLPAANDLVELNRRYRFSRDLPNGSPPSIDPLRCDIEGNPVRVLTFSDVAFEVGVECASDPDCIEDDPSECQYTIPAVFCDSTDFNNNAVWPEDQDVIDFFNVLSGADCPTCNDIDFNNNNVFPEDQDVISFFEVLAGGDCVLPV